LKKIIPGFILLAIFGTAYRYLTVSKTG